MKQQIIELPICCTCLTNHSDDKTGYCINGHDDWVEIGDFNGASLSELNALSGKGGFYPDYISQHKLLKRLARKMKITFSQLKQYNVKSINPCPKHHNKKQKKG